MTPEALQELCEQGQDRLMKTEYLQAEALLAGAEQQAWAVRDWDALSRLYMPLQEARRQRRQRCGEGMVRLDLLAADPTDEPDPQRIVGDFAQGQLLVAGWASIAPAVSLRKLQAAQQLYVETFLAAVFPVGAGSQAGERVVVIMPLPDGRLPEPATQTLETLTSRLPAHSLVFRDGELPRGNRPGTTQTYAEVMAIWERLHTPFLTAADREADPVRKMEGYREAIRVDYACELAHQKLADVAREMLRQEIRSTKSEIRNNEDKSETEKKETSNKML